MSNDKIVFCDTGFVIRLLDRTSDLHENARVTCITTWD